MLNGLRAAAGVVCFVAGTGLLGLYMRSRGRPSHAFGTAILGVAADVWAMSRVKVRLAHHEACVMCLMWTSRSRSHVAAYRVLVPFDCGSFIAIVILAVV